MRRPLLLTAAFLLLLVCASPAGAQAAATGSTVVQLDRGAPAAKSLQAQGVRVTAVRPATATSARWTLPVSGTTAVDATRVDQRGGLVFRAGKRTARLTAPRLTLGRSVTLGAEVGGRRVELFIVTATGSHAVRRSATAGTLGVAGAPVSLSSAGAKALRAALGLRRLAAGRLGTLELTVTVPVASVVTPPAAIPPAVDPTPVVTPDPAPSGPTGPIDNGPPPDPCRVDVARLADHGAPAGATGATTEWVAPAGGTGFGIGDLRSWINYVTTCWNPAGRVEAVDGATLPSDKYDVRFAVRSAAWTAGTVATVSLAGTVAYRGAHDIDTRITDPVVRFNTGTVAAGGLAPGTGTVTASGQYSDRDQLDAPPVPFGGVVVTTLAGPTSAALPAGPLALAASLTAGGQTVFGENYALGANWGTFTVPPLAP